MSTTRTAFAYWENRIAPVFDTTRRIRIVEVESGQIAREEQQTLTDALPEQRPAELARLGVETLVCGAISRRLEEIAEAHGIRVVSFVSGDLREVIDAWLAGRLRGSAFAMPGCHGRGRHRFTSTCNFEQKGHHMRNRQRGGTGMRGGQGRGRTGRPVAGGVGGTCLCPKCGYREPYERGVPCIQKPCPKCGTALTRKQ